MLTYPIDKLPPKLKRTLYKYLNWIETDECPKKFRSKDTSFQKTNIEYFLGFLINYKNIRKDRITNLLWLLHKNIEEYINYLYKHYNKTSSYIRRLNSITGFIEFCKDETKWYKKSYEENIITTRQQLLGKYDIVSSSQMQKKEQKLLDIDFHQLVNAIHGLPTNNHWYETQKKLILKILLRLSWRANNIITLELGTNLEKINDIWRYNFPPDNQKHPRMINNMKMHLIGNFPLEVSKLIDLVLTQRKSEKVQSNHLIITKNQQKMSVNTFSANVKKYSKNIIGVNLNPHIYRDITSSAYINTTYNQYLTDVYLWHFPSVKRSTRYYIQPKIDIAVQDVNKFIDGVLNN